MNALCSSNVNSCLHILPVIGSKPPMPVSQASVTEMEVGFLKTIEFSEIPDAAYSMNRSQSSRSSFVSLVSLVDLYLSALDSSLLTRFMKWRACGIMLPT